mgnify:CR=1 FL=1
MIPGVLMTASGSTAIRDALAADLEVTVDGTEINAVTQSFPADNDKISSFSSRGIHAAGNVKPDVAAVGSSVFSTAVGTGDGGVSFSGTSMASPMVAGLAALVRQANPGWSPLQVKADIMNTAGHDVFVGGSANPSSHKYGPPRVGAGRIDAQSAVSNKVLAYNDANGSVSVSFGPVAADAPLNLTRSVTVDNQSSSPVTYDVEYDPINEVPGADISVSPAQVSLDPGQTTQLTVSLAIDPADLTKSVDPTIGRFGSTGDPRETLAEAFGRLLLEPTSPGVTLRVPVYASPRPASVMTQPGSLAIHRTASTAGDPDQTATFELSGDGLGGDDGVNGIGDGDSHNDIYSLAAGFEILATSGQSPQCDEEIETSCWRLPEEQDADLKMVGYTSDAPLVSDPADALGYFAFAAHKPWPVPANKAIFQVDIDVDSDGKPDLFLYNSRLGDDDIFVSKLLDPAKPAGQRVVDQQLINGRWGDLDTALYDSDVIVIPVSLDVLSDYGIDASNPTVSYGIETYSYFSDQAIDMIDVDPESGDLVDPPTLNLFEPALTVSDADGVGPLVEDQPGNELTVTRNVSSYEADGGKGLMMVHFHNQVGAKAQTVELHGAESSTELFVAPESLSARVDPAGSDLPDPSGTVTFSVDGTEIGSAPLIDGEAELDYSVPSGSTRQIVAEYSGNADFEPSSDQASRYDPILKARVTSKVKRNSRGWYRTPVDVYFTCQTRGSDLTEDCPYPRRLSGDGRNRKINESIVAFDGGKAVVHLRGINIDRTPPVVRIRGVRAGATYRKARRARCAASDRTSGVLGCHVSWRRRGGKVIYRATATDRAGNRKSSRLVVRLSR